MQLQRKIKTGLKLSVIGCVTLTTACATTTTLGTETEREICYQMGAELPTRSRSDTAQTLTEITELYAQFARVCPEHEHQIP